MKYWKTVILAMCIPVMSAAQEKKEVRPAGIEITVSKQGGTEYLKEAVITKKSTIGIVRAAARKFARTYARNYFAVIYAHQVVMSGNEYVQIMNLSGVWGSMDFNQKARPTLIQDTNPMGLFYPTDAYSTLCLIPGTGQSTSPLGISASGVPDRNVFDVGYSGGVVNLTALDKKRTVEIYSPLNIRMTEDYTYETESVEQTSQGWRYVIRFTSKETENTKRTRLTGSGRMFIDETGSVWKVETEDMIDTYSTYIYNNRPLCLVSPYTLTIEYGQDNGYTYTRSVKLDIRWEEPERIPENTRPYSIANNEIRRPFDNKLRSSLYIVFENTVQADKKTARQFRGKMGNGGYRNAFCKDCNTEFWETRLGNYPEYTEIVRVLELKLGPIAGQSAKGFSQLCQENSREYHEYTPEDLEMMYNRQFEQGRELFRQIYGKEYYE